MFRRFLIAGSLGVVLAMTPASCASHTAPAGQPAPPASAAAPAPAPAPPRPEPAHDPAPPPAAARIPDRLSDADFWKLVTDMSEPDGVFRSDNLLSNEVWLQNVIPELQAVAKPDRVYMGVGPEQNFTYIAALKPSMAIIVDIRRGNLDLQLMYKALFEMSADRPEFLSRLFSRKRPDGLTAASSITDVVTAFRDVPPDDALFAANLQAITDHLQKTHGFALLPEDLPGIKYVFEYFAKYGPELTYWMSGGMGGRGGFRNNSPTYGDLMAATDAAGVLRSFMATQENFGVLKALESKNLIVPVVGNFAGPKALRAVGAWLRAHNGVVSAFYLSNVEQYLNMDGIWMDFCANASKLPIDESSQFIRSFRGNGSNFGGGSLDQGLSPMAVDLKACAAPAVH